MSEPQYSLDSTETLTPQAVSRTTPSTRSFSLSFLFLVITACGLFFACLEFSPLLAIGVTVIVTPAMMRTVWITETSNRLGKPLTWPARGKFLIRSLGVVILISVFAACVFALVCMLFGVFGWLLSVMVEATGSTGDAIVVGTAGGMVWGVAAAMLAGLAALLQVWVPNEIRLLQSQADAARHVS